MSKFQNGDQVVKVTKSHKVSHLNNHDFKETEAVQFARGTVTGAYRDSGVWVKWADGNVSIIDDYSLMSENEFEYLPQRVEVYLQTRPSQGPFEVGDKVRILHLDGLTNVARRQIGDITTVARSLGFEDAYRVVGSGNLDDASNLFFGWELEKVELELETVKGLKVGDRVYHPTDESNVVGTITEIRTDGRGEVDWDGDFGVLPHVKNYMDELLPLSERPEPETKDEVVLTLTLEEAKIVQKVLASLTGHINQ